MILTGVQVLNISQVKGKNIVFIQKKIIFHLTHNKVIYQEKIVNIYWIVNCEFYPALDEPGCIHEEPSPDLGLTALEYTGWRNHAS